MWLNQLLGDEPSERRSGHCLTRAGRFSVYRSTGGGVKPRRDKQTSIRRESKVSTDASISGVCNKPTNPHKRMRVQVTQSSLCAPISHFHFISLCAT
jgi:hypothetical protein